MRVRFRYNGEMREGALLGEIHENDPRRHALFVGMEKHTDSSYERLVFVYEHQVIERILEEGDKSYENAAVTYCRQKLIAKMVAQREKPDG